MDADSPSRLDAPDSAVADAEFQRLKTASGRDPQMSGCMVAFAGMLVLTLTPALGNWIPIAQGMGVTLFAGASALLFTGAAVALIGGRSRARRAERERSTALSSLADSAQDREASIRAAVRFLWWGGASRPDGTGPPADADLRARLEPTARRLLDAVERHVLSR